MITMHALDKNSPSRLEKKRPNTPIFLFDTNVWVDYFLGRPEVIQAITDLIKLIRKNHLSIATTVSIKKDVFYIVPRELRRLALTQMQQEGCDKGGRVPSQQSFTQVAWATLDQMDNLATIVPMGMREDFYARNLRKDLSDYEDDTVLATAKSINAERLITSDRRMLDRFPELCMTPAQALEILD